MGACNGVLGEVLSIVQIRGSGNHIYPDGYLHTHAKSAGNRLKAEVAHKPEFVR